MSIMQMILKAVGSLLIVASFAWAGVAASYRQKQRLKQLDLVIWLINELNSTILFTKEEVSLTMAKLASRRDWSFLQKLCENLQEDGMGLAYQRAKFELQSQLPSDVVDVVDEYFRTFGCVNSDSQELKNQQILETLGRLRLEFSAECKNKGNLYGKLGILCGAGVAILLI